MKERENKEIRWVNGVQLGKYLELTKGRVSQLTKAGVFRRGLEKKYDLEECVKNYRANKRNMPRLDQGAPELPLEIPDLKSKSELQEEEDEVIAAATVLNPHQAAYYENRAKIEGMKAESMEIDLELKRRAVVKKDPFYEAIKDLSTKINASLKSMITAIPKRTALAWPNPKERPQLETIINDQVEEILTEISNINPTDLEIEVFA